jgi:hypothetical protein
MPWQQRHRRQTSLRQDHRRGTGGWPTSSPSAPGRPAAAATRIYRRSFGGCRVRSERRKPPSPSVTASWSSPGTCSATTVTTKTSEATTLPAGSSIASANGALRDQAWLAAFDLCDWWSVPPFDAAVDQESQAVVLEVCGSRGRLSGPPGWVKRKRPTLVFDRCAGCGWRGSPRRVGVGWPPGPSRWRPSAPLPALSSCSYSSGSATCTSPSTGAGHEPARRPRAPDRCCRPCRQPRRGRPTNGDGRAHSGNSSPPSQLNESTARPASAEVDTEGSASRRRKLPSRGVLESYPIRALSFAVNAEWRPSRSTWVPRL